MRQPGRFLRGILSLSIRKKFLLGYILAGVLPMMVITLYSYVSGVGNLIRQNEENTVATLKQINQNISSAMSQYESLYTSVYTDKYIIDFFQTNYGDSDYYDMYFYIDDFMKNKLAVMPEISQFSIYSNNFTVPRDENYFMPLTEEEKQEWWYQYSIENPGSVTGGALTYDKNGDPAFVLAKPLIMGKGKFYDCFLYLVVNENKLYSMMEETKEENVCCVLNPLGEIISCRDKSLLGKKLADVLDISEENLRDGADHKVYLDGRRMNLYTEEADNGWRTVMLTDEDKLEQAAMASAWNSVAIFVVSLVITAVLALLISEMISKRLERLTVKVSHVKDGNFKITPSRYPVQDEVGMLEDAFYHMGEKLDFLVREVYQKELMKKASELNLLQEQINPHFLYNTLTSISSLAIRSGDNKTNTLIKLLADFYRISLNKGNSILLVEDELNLTLCYTQIQKIRFGEQLCFHFSVDEELYSQKILKLVLQPLVENSISHGQREDGSPLNIWVEGHRVGKEMVFSVRDDGAGIPPEQLEKLLSNMASGTEGYGLKNVRNRMNLVYGEEGRVEIFSSLEKGTQVKIHIPIDFVPHFLGQEELREEESHL